MPPVARDPYPFEADHVTDEIPRQPPRPIQSRGAHLPPYQEPLAGLPARADKDDEPGTARRRSRAGDPSDSLGGRSPRKLTVTRVAALRGRELTHRGVKLFHRATTADGADRSGLAALTYAVMGNYAVDAAMMVALANTIFFADTGSPGKVLAYLAITVAPFAFIAPLIGPMLDRLQSGRRLALALSSWGRVILLLLMAFNMEPFNPWVIYPCALGSLVLSKAFSVLKAALTPRVLPEQITLVKTNSRLTVFGLMAGGVAGALAAGILWLTNSSGALVFTALCAVAGGWLCLRIPAWVESTEGEIPVEKVRSGGKRGLPTPIVNTLWANSVIRIETGFLALFIAFVIKNQFDEYSEFNQLLLLGIVGGAAGLGGFVGNALGSSLNLAHPLMLSSIALAATTVTTLVAALLPGLMMAAVVGLVGSTASSLAKVCLDSVIQHELPEESRASAFGRSESYLQVSWVFGGIVGLMIGGIWFTGTDAVYSIGFGVVTVLLLVGCVQIFLLPRGKTLVPTFIVPPRRSKGAKASKADPTPTVAQPTARFDADPTAALPPATQEPKPRKPPRRAGTDR